MDQAGEFRLEPFLIRHTKLQEALSADFAPDDFCHTCQ